LKEKERKKEAERKKNRWNIRKEIKIASQEGTFRKSC